jgi:hypothetical protein
MVRTRSRYGLLVSTLGAVALATSVFLPWYAPRAGGPASHHLGSLTAMHLLGDLSVVLPVLAALTVLDTLGSLARPAVPVPAGSGAAVVLLGGVATVCVLYRIVDPPAHALALSPREGAWLALLGALAMVAGGLWPRVADAFEPAEPLAARAAWSALSRWTPQG